MIRQSRLALALTVVLFLLLAGSLLLTQAQPLLEPRPRYPLYGLPALPLAYETGPSALGPAEVTTAATRLIPWSRVVFQSYRDRNWEVYFSDDEGAGLLRLTDHPAVDIEPRLNRGATRVAFTSNRSGNYDIWLMNADGTGLRQLTSHPATDAAPSWSADGQKILFESERTGHSEVFIMNADGSEQIQLTAGGDYNGQPCFSPDGSEIAFVSARTGGYRIWVMNRDGSGARQLSEQAYSAHPVWSPDGTMVAYDADHDQDGDQSLWTMNADGTNQAQRFQVGDEQLWAGSFSPLSKDLAFTRIIFVEYEGQLYWYNARLYFFSLGGGVCQHETCPITERGTEWYPDWQTADIAPPQSRVEPLPEYSPRTELTVHWQGVDEGESGLYAYAIQYRVGAAGQWTFLLTHTHGTSAGYVAEPGTTVYFRSRASDYAGNEEPWPASESGDAHTTFYTHRVQGTVGDARGMGLPAPALEVAPAGASPVTSSPAGTYTAYLIREGPHAITVTRAGYAPLQMELDVTADTAVAHWLPPLDDRMRNGDWETSDALGWGLSGPITPNVTAGAAHHGQWGLALGQNPAATSTWKVREGPPEPRTPAVAWDDSGILHVVWAEGDTLQYATCTASGVCSPAQPLAPGERPDIAIGRDGSAHIIWFESGQVMYSRRAPGEAWSSAEPVGSCGADGGGDYALDVRASGVPHVVWSKEQHAYYSYRLADGTWMPAEPLPETAWRVDVVDMAVAPDGAVHVVCGEGDRCQSVWHTLRAADGQWTEPHQLSGNCHLPTLQVAADSGGGVHIAWRAWVAWQWPLKGLQYVYRSADGAWSEDVVYERTILDDVGVELQGGDRPLCLWLTEGGTHASYRLPDGTWSAAHLVMPESWPDDSAVVYAARPGSDEVALVTVRSVNGIAGIHAATARIHPEVSGEGVARQAVDVPADMHRPVLALDYVFGSEEPGGDDRLTFAVHAGTEITTAVVSAPSSGWQHVWFDLSNYLGRTITLTVGLSSTADEHLSWARVDDVTLGSWLTPVIRVVSPAHVEDPGTVPLPLTIHGDNFVPVPVVRVGTDMVPDMTWVDEQTLEVLLPPSVGLGRQPVWVGNPGGQEAVLPGALQVGYSVLLPLVSRLAPRW